MSPWRQQILHLGKLLALLDGLEKILHICSTVSYDSPWGYQQQAIKAGGNTATWGRGGCHQLWTSALSDDIWQQGSSEKGLFMHRV